MTEPVTSYTQRFVRCQWALDRDLAYARHYPAVSWAASFARDIGAIGTWRARNGDPGWSARRARLAGLLAEADRVGELAELIGLTALPPRQRMAILAGRLVREGLLQQSAVSAADAYSDAARSAALADSVIAVADLCDELAGQGVAASVIEDQDYSALLRAREDAGNAKQVQAMAAKLLDSLSVLGHGQAPASEQLATDQPGQAHD